MACERCGYELKVGDFPFCKGRPEDHQGATHGVVGDEVDVWIKHGLCDEYTGEPKHYTSKAEIAREAKRRGLVNRVEHRGTKDGDRNKHTQRFI